MAWSTTGRNRRATVQAALITDISLHTGDPGASGTDNEVSGGGYSRQAPSFGAASNGVVGLSDPVAFSGPAETAVAFAGMWEGSDFLGAVPRGGGDSAFNAAGEYNIATFNVNSSGAIA